MKKIFIIFLFLFCVFNCMPMNDTTSNAINDIIDETGIEESNKNADRWDCYGRCQKC